MMLLDINLQMIERSADYEPNDKPNDKRGTIGSPEERQNEKKGFDNPEHYPKTPSGFQCFVCGKQFDTNEERIEHLEEAAHGSMYDTASPQEREDTRRLQ
jgi:hypothetical protein